MKKARVFFIVQSLLLGLLIIGALVLYFVDQSIGKNELNRRQEGLQNVHDKTIAQITDAIDNFAILVSGIRSYIKHSENFPPADELQSFINDQLEDLNYQDSIVVSFVDTSHTFRYSFTRTVMDPVGLVGTRLEAVRDEAQIKQIDSMIRDERLHMMDLINLREGWVGAPLNFGVVRDGQLIGYIVPILNFKTVLERVYRLGAGRNHVFRFVTSEGFDLDRERVHNLTKVYNPNEDPEYYKNFNLDPESFVYSSFSIHGLYLQIGTSYKFPYKRSEYLTYLLYGWYVMLFLLAALVARQVYSFRQAGHRIEKDLEEAQRLTHISSWTWNMVTNERTWSDEFYRICGLAPGDGRLNAETAVNFIHPDDSESAIQAVDEAIQNGTSYVYEKRIVRLDGEIRFVRTDGKVISDKNGQPIWMVGTMRDITARKKLESDLIQAIHSGQEQERKRLAQELHDGLGQQLAATKMMLSAIDLKADYNDQENLEYLEKALGVLDEAIAEARNISHDLTPATLETRGLVAAIAKVAQNLSDSHNMETHFSGSGLADKRFDPLIELGLFRITQELTTNILKHAQASKVTISLGQPGESLILRVSDNGIGFQGTLEEMQTNGIGLRNISARVRSLHGKLSLDSSGEKGTTVMVEVPINGQVKND